MVVQEKQKWEGFTHTGEDSESRCEWSADRAGWDKAITQRKLSSYGIADVQVVSWVEDHTKVRQNDS